MLVTVGLSAVLTIAAGWWKSICPEEELRPDNGAVLAWIEGDNEASIDEVAALPEDAWRSFAEIKPEQHRFGNYGVWFRVILPPVREGGSSLISSPSMGCFAVRAYWQRDGAWRVQRGGQDLGMRERAVFSSETAFIIDRPLNESTTVYIRFLEEDRPLEWMRYWENAMDGRANLELGTYLYIGYFAMWFAVLAYNLLLAVVLKRRAIFTYVLYVAAFGAMIFFGSGIDGLFVGWEVTAARVTAGILLVFLQVGALSWFARDLLGMEGSHRAKRFFLTTDIVLGSCVALVGLWAASLISGDIMYLAVTAGVVAICCGLLAFAVVRCWKGQLIARWFLLAFSPGLGAFVWMWILSFDEGLPDHLSTVPFLVGSGAEFVLMSLVLAFHYREIERENVRIKAEQAETLQREVAARTLQLRELTAQLGASNRMKDRIFSVLGHDLRSPVATNISFAEALEQEPTFLPPEELAHQAGWLKRANEQLLQLLEDLLSWARMEGGEMKLTLSEVSVAKLVAAPVELLSAVGRAKRITIETQIPAELKVRVDEKTMQAVIRNLLSNSLKFTANGGRVVIRAEQAESRVLLSVADNGLGMAADVVERLMGGGDGVSTEGTAKEKGAGFGWILCRQFVSVNGGELRVWSEPSRGTRVDIILASTTESSIAERASTPVGEVSNR